MNDWNPMEEAFRSISFNSYSRGPAAHLPVQYMPCYTTQNSDNVGAERDENLQLFIEGFPSDLKESGLKHFLETIGCNPLSVKIVHLQTHRRHLSVVEFASIKESTKAIELINKQKIYKLSISFASTELDRDERDRLIQREKADFAKKFNNSIEEDMKPKISLENGVINHSNSYPMSPISSSGSEDIAREEVLSSLASSDKLCKLLQEPDADCSYCDEMPTLDHLHFIISQNQIVDPKQLPDLIDFDISCQTCGKTNGLKQCGQCKNAYYCSRRCQTANWAVHIQSCRPSDPSLKSNESVVNLLSKPRKEPDTGNGLSVVSQTNQTPVPTKVMTTKTVEKPKTPEQQKIVEKVRTPVSSPVKCDEVQTSPKVVFQRSGLQNVNLKRTINFQNKEETQSSGAVAVKAVESLLGSMKNGITIDVLLCDQINNKAQFWCLLEGKQYEDLAQSLDDYYSKSAKECTPRKGDVVVVKASDDAFYRAFIIDVEGSEANVLMIDVGYNEKVSKVYELTATHSTPLALSLLLYPKTGPQKSVIDVYFERDVPMFEALVVKQSGCIFLKIDGQLIQALDYKSSVDLVVGKDKKRPKDLTDILKYELPIATPIDALVLYQEEENQNVFYVAKDELSLPRLMTSCAALSVQYSEGTRVKPSVGKIYLAKCSDGDWYRSLVTSVDSDKSVVTYIDFGNSETVENKYFMDLSKELKVNKEDPVVVKCESIATDLKSSGELYEKIGKACDGSFLLKMQVMKYEMGVHYVKVF